MKYPWKGAAQAMSADAFAVAAADLGCEEAAIRAIWEVEASGEGFLSDGSLIRRFEPHKMPGATTDWRDSLKIGSADRERMFLEAFEAQPEAALQASSWAGPQIMGFNHHDAGYGSAFEMVSEMAGSEDSHLIAFVRLTTAWGLASAIRAHDWRTIENRYNGGGQGGTYARKIEAAYRKHSGGRVSPAVVRFGDQGAQVKRLQQVLGIEADGAFGPATDAAVRAFQAGAGLPVDGLVGKRTWGALVAMRDAEPARQKTAVDQIAGQILDWGLKGGGGIGAGALLERAPVFAVDALFYGGAALALVVASVLVFRFVRRAA